MKNKIENFERDLETTKKMLEILELKNIITEVVNSFNGLSERSDTAEERIRKIKYWSKENVHNEEQRDQR